MSKSYTLYAYTLQVLLHQENDIPVMQGRAFAISPGLYSMVAVEKTEVRRKGRG